MQSVDNQGRLWQCSYTAPPFHPVPPGQQEAQLRGLVQQGTKSEPCDSKQDQRPGLLVDVLQLPAVDAQSYAGWPRRRRRRNGAEAVIPHTQSSHGRTHCAGSKRVPGSPAWLRVCWGVCWAPVPHFASPAEEGLAVGHRVCRTAGMVPGSHWLLVICPQPGQSWLHGVTRPMG